MSSGGIEPVDSDAVDGRTLGVADRRPDEVATTSTRCGVGATRSSTSSAAVHVPAVVERDDRGRADLGVVAVARADLVKGRTRARLAAAGKRTAVISSSCSSAVSFGPRKNSRAAIERSPRCERDLDRRVERDGGGRELGPRRREGERAADRAAVARRAVAGVAAAPRGAAAASARRRGSSSSACCRTSAPITSVPSRSSIASSPATRLTSTSERRLHDAATFISGTRLWPPASTRTPSPAREQRQRLVDRCRARGTRTERTSRCARSSASGSACVRAAEVLDGREDQLGGAHVDEIMDHRLAGAEREPAGLADVVGHLERLAAARVADRRPAGDARPDVVEHVPVEADPLAGGEADLPVARVLVLEQEARPDGGFAERCSSSSRSSCAASRRRRAAAPSATPYAAASVRHNDVYLSTPVANA